MGFSLESIERLAKYSLIGGYPLFYIDSACCVLCADCANKDREETDPRFDQTMKPVLGEVNWEANDLYCDRCTVQIESAYGDNNE